MTNATVSKARNARLHAVEEQQARAARQRKLRNLGFWGVGLLVVAGLLGYAMLNSRPNVGATTKVAPPFTLTDTAGKTVTLADYRGRNVILYFSEGAGCEACLLQMGKIEADKAAFDKANITVLPVVMNSRDQILADMATNKVTTPFLLDNGIVSREYGTLGKGMHAGLPGHSFVLIDSAGMQRWYGEYPSMWLDPNELLKTVQGVLAA